MIGNQSSPSILDVSDDAVESIGYESKREATS